MEYSNSQRLAAVLSEWARPVIAQLASQKLMKIPFLQSLQATIGGSGMVGQEYSLSEDLQPFILPVVNSLITPIMEHYLNGVPDAAIPAMAKAIVKQMAMSGTYSILDGLITFEQQDILELSSLLDKNLPVIESEEYEVIH